jgi:cytochrome c553
MARLLNAWKRPTFTRSNPMKSAHVILMCAVTASTIGCTNLERSRDLANPDVSATTLAQQVCANCHGLTGNARSPNFPNLASQTEAYVEAQLSGFKSHGRHDPAGFEYMWGLSRSLTEGQIKGLAAYYASQTPTAQVVEGDHTRFDAGKEVFENGVPAKGIPPCASCHGPRAQGNATFPRLAGQHADYLVKQLIVFQRTDERPEGSVMKTVAHELTPQNIGDVCGYLQSLSGS